VRILGTKRAEMAGGWRSLHNEELHNLHASQDDIRVINSRTMRWENHVTRMGKCEMCTKLC
jgi:hypothetical protein